jgi:hypothetical protein
MTPFFCIPHAGLRDIGSIIPHLFPPRGADYAVARADFSEGSARFFAMRLHESKKQRIAFQMLFHLRQLKADSLTPCKIQVPGLQSPN